jgi:hypothetical protein
MARARIAWELLRWCSCLSPFVVPLEPDRDYAWWFGERADADR